jgi:uncharacterized protein (DUF4213/DUF364 family)
MINRQQDIMKEMLDSVPDGTVENIVAGKHWTAVSVHVENIRTCGLSSTLSDQVWSGHLNAASVQGLQISAKNLAMRLSTDNQAISSVAGAALNALLQYIFLSALVNKSLPFDILECNAEDLILQHGKGRRVAIVGHFPFIERIKSRVNHLDVLEYNPQPGDLPAEAAEQVLPLADVIAITGMAWINGSLDNLLALCPPEAQVLVLGASTPLSPVLFSHGVNYLCGALVRNIDPVMKAIGEGAVFRQIIPVGLQLVTIFPHSSAKKGPINS